MNVTSLGRLEKVDLRSIWNTEASHFTPWLAREDNLELLGDAIDIRLELEAQEKEVGPFRADILCKDRDTDHWVLVENQLERTDHTHMGQLITYAAGLKAVTIVWIAARFTEEHRAALDWMNEITDNTFNFFGLEIELWRIGGSTVAPKFNVVSKPNDWSRSVAKSTASLELTPAKELQLEFWTSFVAYVRERGSKVRPTKALPQHWMNIAVGRSQFGMSAIASLWNSVTESSDTGEIRVELSIYTDDSDMHFDMLAEHKSTIEDELGCPLYWHKPEGKRQRKIYDRMDAILDDRDSWLDMHEWIIRRLEEFSKVFRHRIKQLP
jgi:hypothetical protein